MVALVLCAMHNAMSCALALKVLPPLFNGLLGEKSRKESLQAEHDVPIQVCR